MKKIKTVVLPIAGLGTRFLPITKTIPKEMLSILDRPLIDYAVEEAFGAGIENFVFIINKENNYPSLYFSPNKKIDKVLKVKNKLQLIKRINRSNIKKKNIYLVIQPSPLGLGDAILRAQPIIKDEDFAVILPDDLIKGHNCLKEMIEVYNKERASIIGVMKVEKNDVNKYGIVKPIKIKNKLIFIDKLIEKPDVKNSPSNIAIVGRYILRNSIFKFLKKTKKGSGGEIQLTDAISLSKMEEEVLGYEFRGKRFDCGSKLGFLEAQIAFALDDKEIGKKSEKIIIRISNQLTGKKICN